ncbi:MAG: hypothetical protein WB918_03520 [Candidatus Sulfotelmatobacter sp.]
MCTGKLAVTEVLEQTDDVSFKVALSNTTVGRLLVQKPCPVMMIVLAL